MYWVYKKHEMHLMQTVLRNQSPAAYEYREWKQPDCDAETIHNPQSYLAGYQRDLAVIERLKRMIFDDCQTFIRKETIVALST
nr:hypothetical protein [Tanacetum cinerariifolium]